MQCFSVPGLAPRGGEAQACVAAEGPQVLDAGGGGTGADGCGGLCCAWNRAGHYTSSHSTLPLCFEGGLVYLWTICLLAPEYRCPGDRAQGPVSPGGMCQAQRLENKREKIKEGRKMDGKREERGASTVPLEMRGVREGFSDEVTLGRKNCRQEN